MSFKFNIGDLVITKEAAANCTVSAEHGIAARHPNHLLVVQRESQECPGGTQYHYVFGGDQPRKMNEIELMLASEFDWAGLAALQKKAAAELEEAEEAAREARYEKRYPKSTMPKDNKPSDENPVE